MNANIDPTYPMVVYFVEQGKRKFAAKDLMGDLSFTDNINASNVALCYTPDDVIQVVSTFRLMDFPPRLLSESLQRIRDDQDFGDVSRALATDIIRLQSGGLMARHPDSPDEPDWFFCEGEWKREPALSSSFHYLKSKQLLNVEPPARRVDGLSECKYVLRLEKGQRLLRWCRLLCGEGLS